MISIVSFSCSIEKNKMKDESQEQQYMLLEGHSSIIIAQHGEKEDTRETARCVLLLLMVFIVWLLCFTAWMCQRRRRYDHGGSFLSKDVEDSSSSPFLSPPTLIGYPGAARHPISYEHHHVPDAPAPLSPLPPLPAYEHLPSAPPLP